MGIAFYCEIAGLTSLPAKEPAKRKTLGRTFMQRPAGIA